MNAKQLSTGLAAVLVILSMAMIGSSTRAAAQTAKVLHSFNVTGEDGNHPWGGLVYATGHLYGTTYEGGTAGTGVCSSIAPYSCGIVFELMVGSSGNWVEKVLHNFHGTDGWEPSGNLILGNGNLNVYGTTCVGGTGTCKNQGSSNVIGCGTAFMLTLASGGTWKETVLHSFADDGEDGINPYAGLVSDAAGNLYGTTYNGGAYGYGTVFELTEVAGGGRMETVLYSFNFKAGDAANPYGNLILDSAGNLYGTTAGGGAFDGGTVFELTPGPGGIWTETIAHNFVYNYTDGYLPTGSLAMDTQGVIYGTTELGGSSGHGIVYELVPDVGGSWSEYILYDFDSVAGVAPFNAGVIIGSDGSLYGTTEQGGQNGYGTVFNLARQNGGGWALQTLHNFGNASDGANPFAGLTMDAAGNLYGTTIGGGAGACLELAGTKAGCGTVFEIKP